MVNKKPTILIGFEPKLFGLGLQALFLYFYPPSVNFFEPKDVLTNFM